MKRKPWLIVTYEDALEKCEDLKKVSEVFDIIVVKKEDLQATAKLIEEMREGRKIKYAPVAQLDSAKVS